MRINLYEHIDTFEQLFDARSQNSTVFLNENISENELKDIMFEFFSKFDPLLKKKNDEKQDNRNKEILPEVQKTFCSGDFNKRDRIVIYGAGVFTQNLIKLVPGDCIEAIVGIVDQDPLKRGTLLNDIKVYSPDELLSLSPQTVIIGSLAFTKQIEKNIKILYSGQKHLPSIIKFQS